MNYASLKRADGVVQVVEQLPSKHEAMCPKEVSSKKMRN
jgi:hypothetical protein